MKREKSSFGHRAPLPVQCRRVQCTALGSISVLPPSCLCSRRDLAVLARSVICLFFKKTDMVKSSLGVVHDLFNAFGLHLVKNYYFSLYFKLYIMENFVSLAALHVTLLQ